MLTDAAWSTVAGLRHGFLDAADCPNAPDWALVVGAPVALPRQVHGTVVVEALTIGVDRPEADAVTTRPDQPLAGILTADCVPVLLLDRRQRAAAAVHAGWRGAATGVLEAAVTFLRARHQVCATDLEALVGPAIGPCCYRVGSEVRTAFEERTGACTAVAWDPRPDGLFVDLRVAARALLQNVGVAHVTLGGGCTRCDPRFHSFRRDGERAGRQLSFIGWS